MNACLVINKSVLHTGVLRGPRTRYLRKLLAPRGSLGSRKSFMMDDCTQEQTLEMKTEAWTPGWRLEMETGDWRCSDPVLQLGSRCSRQLLVIETLLCMAGS